MNMEHQLPITRSERTRAVWQRRVQVEQQQASGNKVHVVFAMACAGSRA